MKIFGESIDGPSRWYIMVPPVLLIGFLTGLFFVATASQTRLQPANERVRVSQDRQKALSDYLALIRDAEASLRGYLLTGDAQYLQPYNLAIPKVDGALNNLRVNYAGNETAQEEIRQLRILTGKKLGEQEATLSLYKAQGAGRAIQLVRTDFGEQVMDEIRMRVRRLQDVESAELAKATSGWRDDLALTRWITAGGAALNVILVLVAFRLVYKDMRRRARQATELRDQKFELERLVAERTQELATLSTHLQNVAEREKSSLARELHDELGGLLVASRMDLSWLEQHLPPMDSALQQRVKRIHQNLSAGVDLKRRVVEELRPTLLDSMGLFAALRWQFKESCGSSGLKCTESYPTDEPQFAPEAAIAVFRVLQESTTNILKHAKALSVDVAVAIDDESFVLRITDDGKGIAPDRLAAAGSHGLASMRHRILALGGRFQLECPGSGGTVLTARIPLSRALTPHWADLQTAAS
jgi:signal transduction histidine kinase